MPKTPRIEIEYCTQCRWLLRAAWMAQELLTTFPIEIGELAKLPGIGGVFEIRVGGNPVWSRAEMGRFPEMKELNNSFAMGSRQAETWAILIDEAGGTLASLTFSSPLLRWRPLHYCARPSPADAFRIPSFSFVSRSNSAIHCSRERLLRLVAFTVLSSQSIASAPER